MAEEALFNTKQMLSSDVRIIRLKKHKKTQKREVWNTTARMNDIPDAFAKVVKKCPPTATLSVTQAQIRTAFNPIATQRDIRPSATKCSGKLE